MFNLLCSQGHRPIFHQALGAEVVVFDEGLDGVAVFNFGANMLVGRKVTESEMNLDRLNIYVAN